MDKLDLLFIRACKSRKPEQRLKSVYRRFYLDSCKSDKEYYKILNMILTPMVDKYIPLSLEVYLREMNSYLAYASYTKELEPYEIHFRIILNHIRFVEISKIRQVGYNPPARFRNKDKV